MNRLSSIAIASAAGAALVLAGAPAANAAIKPGKGMDGIKIGDLKRTLVEKKGTPATKKTEENPILGKVKYFEYGLNQLTLGAWISSGRVYNLATEDPAQRTGSGIGVNSTKKEIKGAYPDASCEKVSGRKKICTLGKFKAGKIVTTFRIKGKTVYQVEVGRVID